MRCLRVHTGWLRAPLLLPMHSAILSRHRSVHSCGAVTSEAADACAAPAHLEKQGLNQPAHTAASLLCARVLCATAEGGGDIAATRTAAR